MGMSQVLGFEIGLKQQCLFCKRLFQRVQASNHHLIFLGECTFRKMSSSQLATSDLKGENSIQFENWPKIYIPLW